MHDRNESAVKAKSLLLHYMAYALNGGFGNRAALLEGDTVYELKEIVDHIIAAAVEEMKRERATTNG